jgi:MFS family permease
MRRTRELRASLSAVSTAGPQQRIAARRPAVAMSTRRLLAINAMWLGQGAHWPPISFQLVPVAAFMLAGGSADLLIGHVYAAGNLFALIAPVLAGWLSDRTSTRWGRRRPWIVAGTAVNLAGLGLLAASGSTLTLALAYMLVQLAFNLAGGAYAAVIPDVVPPADRGRASGLLGMMNALGAVVGLAAVTAALAVFHETRQGLVVGYSAVAAVMLLTTVVSVLAIEERPHPPTPHERLELDAGVFVAATAAVIAVAAWLVLLLVPLGVLMLPVGLVAAGAALVAVVWALREQRIRGFFAAFRSRDFFWTFATRAFVMMGIATIQPFLAVYFRQVIHAKNPGTLAGEWGLALLAGAIVPAVIGGRLSDRLGRRKPFVYAAGVLQGLVASVLLFGLLRSVPLIFVLGVVFGAGYGLYVAVDWALACDVLPDRARSSGRDMGLWHIAFTLPPALAPAIFAPILHSFNQPGHQILGLTTGDFLGFRLVFAGAVVWFILGTVFVSRIRAVR